MINDKSIQDYLGRQSVKIINAEFNKINGGLTIELKGPIKIQEVEKYLSDYLSNIIAKDKIFYKWAIEEEYELNEAYLNDLKNYLSQSLANFNKETKFLYLYEENYLFVKVANIIEENYLRKNKAYKLIKSKIKNDCGKDIDIKISVENTVCLEEFMEKRREEEKKISQEKINDQPISKAKVNKSNKNTEFSIGKKIKDDPIDIASLTDETFWATIEGKVFNIAEKEIKDSKYIVTFYIYDETSATSCKAFWSKDLYLKFKDNIEEDDPVIVKGRYQMDSFSKSYVLTIDSLARGQYKEIIDLEKNKRVELRTHSRMSEMEGFIDLKSLYKKLSTWGHKAIGITDLNVVQAYPEAMSLSEKYDIKTLYGLDASLALDYLPICIGPSETDSYVVFDIETTGLANNYDGITEIGGVKIKDGKVVDSFSSLVNPQMEIGEKIVKLTGITNEMVAGERTIDEVLPEFIEFSRGSSLVAHNAEFDISHLRTQAVKLGLEFDFPYVDTLYLARFLHPELKNHRLSTLSKFFGVSLVNHHRAVDDAEATANIFIKLIEELDEKSLDLSEDLNTIDTDWPKTATNFYNALILIKNDQGRKNLYQLITKSHTEHFYKSPKILINDLENHREGLLIGSGNIEGRLYQAILHRAPEEELIRIAEKYDFLEVQSPKNYEHLIENSDSRNGLASKEDLERITRIIIDLGKKLFIPVVATGDIYYLNESDHIYREIVKSVKYNRPSGDSKELYLKATRQVLDEFAFLGEDLAYEIVVKNSNKIADIIDDVRPIPKGRFSPNVEGAEEELRSITINKAKEIYGDNLPEIVEARIKKELDSIISNGYAALYMIARKLVLKSNEDGYVVGSRGSVGSSLVATMSGITEVNPLVAHYICPKCKKSEFFVKENYDTGLDLPDKDCPICGIPYKKEGHNIPFEVFLGFEGNKEPDIDLNFAGEYQSIVHQYTEELFGSNFVYRAGTITTIADNTAFGYVKKYYEKLDKNVSPAQIAYLQKGIVGTKRSTGQHPGGIMIVPHENEMEDFSPVNHPANDPTSGIKTTHFAYRAIEETILKLDLLGHDVPSIIKKLGELTGINPEEIDLTDEKTMSLYSSTEALDLKTEIPNLDVGTLGIPEFGTNFVRQMLKDTKPKTMGELFRISGLSHGTDVWLNNAQDLVRNKEAVLSEVICTRDDIMSFLIQKGLESNDAFTIMEKVRKGRGLTEEQIHLMNSVDLPSWYIDSCLKIKYMFPKAHATAYVLMSFRIAYFKTYYPQAFYASYFTTKLADFPGAFAFSGLGPVQGEMKRIKSLGFDASNKEQLNYVVLELIEEMLARGYEFQDPEIGKCERESFSVSNDGKIVVPYSAIENISAQQSRDIYDACLEGSFISVENFVDRTGINKSAIESLRSNGLLDHLQETNQMDLFDMF